MIPWDTHNMDWPHHIPHRPDTLCLRLNLHYYVAYIIVTLFLVVFITRQWLAKYTLVTSRWTDSPGHMQSTHGDIRKP